MTNDWRDPATMFDMVYDQHGMAPQVAFFDPAPVVPVKQLRDRLATTAGRRITQKKLEEVLDSGWVQVGELAYAPGEHGVALYAEARIALLLELEQVGYTSSDLLGIAREDEELVEDLREFGFAYDDNDALVVLHSYDKEIDALQRQITWSEAALTGKRPPLVDATWPEDLVTEQTVADLREQLQHRRAQREKWVRVADSKPETWTSEMRRAIEKAAYLVKHETEQTRFFIWQWHRDQILEGFSPLVQVDDVARTEPCVDWEATLKSPRFLARPSPVRLRIPGAILEGERLTTTRALPPTEYRDFYERWDLGSYFRILAEVRNRRICANCLTPLPQGADRRRAYCDERCRSAARTRAWRQANPRRAAEHQRRYWSSVPEID